MRNNQKVQNKASREIASGKKVNTAADDAAVMAISEELMKRAKELSQGSSNISYGIDLTNIADGAMSSVSESISDLTANSIRAMNGTMSDSDRAILQESNKQTIKTIDHLVNNTTYNGKKLLDGSSQNIAIFTGTSSANISGANLSSESLGLSNFSVENAGEIDLSVLDDALSKVSSTRSKMGAQANGLSAALRSNQVTAENTVAAQSRMSDTDMYDAIARKESSNYIGAAQVLMMRNQMKQDQNMVSMLTQ
jgi:flagellin